MRKILLAGNWKMYKGIKETEIFIKELKEEIDEEIFEKSDIAICPPFTSLYIASNLLKDSKIFLGAQNVFYEKEGAYTGEISPKMLKEIGVKYVIVGHSERREIGKEDDEMIAKKVKAVIDEDMIPILCVGEKLEEREKGIEKEIVEKQIISGLKFLTQRDEFVIAYEPVWAIGTGKTATPEIAGEMQGFIRKKIGEIFGKDKAEKTRILYGGSIKPENIEELIKHPEIDGGLIGGASLKKESFLSIIKNSIRSLK
ncbi:MAG: triose-phosphate isomerase [candidate division WOR-3 bacterium]